MPECRVALHRPAADAYATGAVPAALYATQLILTADVRAGRLAEAVEPARRAAAVAAEHGLSIHVARFNLWLYALYTYLGRDKDARAARDACRNAGPAPGRSLPPGMLRRAELPDHLQAGRFDAARDILAEVLDEVTTAPSVTDLHTLLDCAEALDRIPGPARTDQIKALTSALEHVAVPGPTPLTEAIAAVIDPDETAGTRRLAAVVEPLAERWRFLAGRALLILAERERRSGGTGAAGRLHAAEAAFAEAGAGAWVRRARRELRALAPADPGPGRLSPQEFRIATLAASGLSNREIGAELALSARTVSNYLYQIFPKLGIRSRAALRDALAMVSEMTPARTP